MLTGMPPQDGALAESLKGGFSRRYIRQQHELFHHGHGFQQLLRLHLDLVQGEKEIFNFNRSRDRVSLNEEEVIDSDMELSSPLGTVGESKKDHHVK